MFHGLMISTVTGEVMDEVLLTKPPGFKLNATVRASQLANFQPDPSLDLNSIDTDGEQADLQAGRAPACAAACQLPALPQPQP